MLCRTFLLSGEARLRRLLVHVQSTWESKLKFSWRGLADQGTLVEFNVDLNRIATTADRWAQKGIVEVGGDGVWAFQISTASAGPLMRGQAVMGQLILL